MTDAVSLSVSGDVSVVYRKFLVHGIAPKNIHRFDNNVMCI